MVRIELDGHKLTKAWSGRLLYEIKDHKSVENPGRLVDSGAESAPVIFHEPSQSAATEIAADS